MMLSLGSRESNDIRSLGELFVYISDEMADIRWLQALQMLLQLFRSTLSENAELTEEKINELVDNFLDTLPSLLKSLLWLHRSSEFAIVYCQVLNFQGA